MNDKATKPNNGTIQKNGNLKKNGKDLLAKSIDIEKSISLKVKDTSAKTKDIATKTKVDTTKAKEAPTKVKEASDKVKVIVKKNRNIFDETLPSKDVARHLWTPIFLAMLSIGFNPSLLQLVLSGFGTSTASIVLDSACGLNIISGSLALVAFLYASKYHKNHPLVKLGKNLAFLHGIFLLVLAYGAIGEGSEGMVDWLFELIENPFAYLAFVFIFAFLAAVILPIPVELALAGYIVYLQDPSSSFLGLGIFGAFLLISIVMGIAKGLGSWIVFVIGIKVETLVAGYMKWRWFRKMMMATHKFCVKFGYLAMYFIMCIPLMTDTVPLYIFSILNKKGDVFELKWFVISNFWAGIARTLVVGITVVGGLLTYGYVA